MRGRFEVQLRITLGWNLLPGKSLTDLNQVFIKPLSVVINLQAYDLTHSLLCIIKKRTNFQSALERRTDRDGSKPAG